MRSRRRAYPDGPWRSPGAATQAAEHGVASGPMDLFDRSEADNPRGVPLADRMRPVRLSEVVGQSQLLGPGKLLGAAIVADDVPSMVLWGPPGTGKTTLARVIAAETEARFVTLNAVLDGVADLRREVEGAREQRRMYGKSTILFVDEIHRFNRAQQDALLPHVERGTVVLIGATTENPSFSVNAALLSRARIFELHSLAEGDLRLLLERALVDQARGLGPLGLTAGADALSTIAAAAQGDARRALDVLEAAAKHAKRRPVQAPQGDAPPAGPELTVADVEQAMATATLLYDRSGEEHYNVVSAFIKSMRGSDPDAALYWMMRMLGAGEDPMFVLRRMLIFASEDIGNADPNALRMVVAADTAFQRIGMPEGTHTLSQCCLYLACAPKSNASYEAWTAAQREVKKSGALPVPRKLRNAATRHMKAAGYGQGYRYPHSEGGYATGETYLPDALADQRYYSPRDSGIETRIAARLRSLRGEDGEDGGD